MSLLLARLAGGSTLTLTIPAATGTSSSAAPLVLVGLVEPVATSAAAGPAPVFATAVVVGASGVSTSAPAPATVVSTPVGSPGGTTSTPAPGSTLTFGIPAATATATSTAPIDADAAVPPATGGSTGRFGYALEQQPTPLTPVPQQIRLAIPAATVHASATAPVLRIEEDLFSELEAWLAEADELAALSYLSPV